MSSRPRAIPWQLTHPYKAFLSLTIHVPLLFMYLLYVAFILISAAVSCLFKCMYTTWSPVSGISLFRNAPGKSTVATARFCLAAIAVSMNTLDVLAVGEAPLL